MRSEIRRGTAQDVENLNNHQPSMTFVPYRSPSSAIAVWAMHVKLTLQRSQHPTHKKEKEEISMRGIVRSIVVNCGLLIAICLPGFSQAATDATERLRVQVLALHNPLLPPSLRIRGRSA